MATNSTKTPKVKATVDFASCEFYFSHQDATCWLCGTVVPKGTPHTCSSKESK